MSRERHGRSTIGRVGGQPDPTHCGSPGLPGEIVEYVIDVLASTSQVWDEDSRLRGTPRRPPYLSTDGEMALVRVGAAHRRALLCSGTGEPASDRRLADALALDPLPTLAGLDDGWAVVAWDARRQELLAGRDPLGVEPLYLLSHADGGVSLSTRIPPLLRASEARALDDQGLGQYLLTGHTGPTRTMFRQISRVVPGRLYRWRREGSAARWALTIQAIPQRSPRSPADVGWFESAIQERIPSDARLGCVLDPGPASTVLVACAVRRAREEVRTYGIGGTGPRRLEQAEWTEHNARVLGTHHVTVPAAPIETGVWLRTFLRAHGEPNGGSAAITRTGLALRAAQDVGVLILDEEGPGSGRPSTARFRHPDQWEGALARSELAWLARARPETARTVLARVRAHDKAEREAWHRHARWAGDSCPPSAPRLEVAHHAALAAGVEAAVPWVATMDAGWRDARRGYRPETAPADLIKSAVPAGIRVGRPAADDDLLGAIPESGYTFEVGSRESIIGRWLGTAGQRDLLNRASRVPRLRHRLSVLGVWEEEFDGGSYECPL